MATRRAFSAALAGAAAAACLPAPSCAADATADFVYIGMHGNQITLARFDPVSGSLTLTGPAGELPSPTWLIVHPRLPVLYSDSELGNDGRVHGSVAAFRIDRTTGMLTKFSQVDAGGGGTTYLWFDAPSMTILASDYGAGAVAAMPVGSDGSVSPFVSLITDTGSGPSPRQKSPHAHCAVVDPSGHFVLVADLGADRVFVYPFDRATRTLRRDPPGRERHWVAPPGSGPRHVTFHPNGRIAYVYCELTADLETFGWDARTGRLTLRQTLSTNSPGFAGKSAAAELAVSRDGRFVYASNRGENTIVAYRVDAATGELTLLQRVPGGGDPWSFGLHPSGRWMLVADEHTSGVGVRRVDPATGRLSDTGVTLATPTPVCVAFVPQA